MFHASADNIDDLMHAVLTRLLSGSRSNYRVTSKKGASTEIFGALLQLNNPRARLGRSVTRARVYSAIGELLWYLSGSNALDQIQYYIKDYHLFSDDGLHSMEHMDQEYLRHSAGAIPHHQIAMNGSV